jgi:hypothetical protein
MKAVLVPVEMHDRVRSVLETAQWGEFVDKREDAELFGLELAVGVVASVEPLRARRWRRP